MKGMVQELVTMVGGTKANGHTTENQQHSEEGLGERASKILRKALPSAHDNQHQDNINELVVNNAKEVKPEEVIPMDEPESEFKDF